MKNVEKINGLLSDQKKCRNAYVSVDLKINV